MRQWIASLLAAGVAASTACVATVVLLDGAVAFSNGLVFMGAGSAVIVLACLLADRS